MEWQSTVDHDGPWEALVSDGATFAFVWPGDGCWFWAIVGTITGTRATSLDDAKDAAWAAVYRSTR